MRIYIKNTVFAGYENDIRALTASFYPGAELVFLRKTDDAEAETGHSDDGHAAGGSGTCGTAEDKEMDPAYAAFCRHDENAAVCTFNNGDITIDIDRLADRVKRDSKRFEEKTNLKQQLYIELSRQTGRKLPWGTLTGIRPVRIREMLEAKGCSQAETDAELRERFMISESKLRLMNDIADREKRLLSSIDYMNGCSIYIGIPFCPTRCLYCSFTSNQVGENDPRPDRYVECVCRELEALCDGRKDSEYAHFDKSRLKTLYIGGGTPTALNERQLEKLLDKVGELFGVPDEYTVEAGRPDSITREKLELLKSHGVGRISVNPQTFNQKTLDLIGRRHTVEQTVWAYELARSMCFDNINMDLIMGLPGENISDVINTLDKVRELKPDSLTVHALAVKRAARLSTEGKAWGGIERKGSSPDISEADEVGRMISLGAECAHDLGMEPYYLYRQKNMAGNQDNVGYAVPGRECLYNILMMEEKHTVYGIGAGASTKTVYREKNSSNGEVFKNKIIRNDNVKNLNDYLIYTF